MSSTRTPLTGNPLAVFTDARGLTDKEMQLWREMNLSETTFASRIGNLLLDEPDRHGVAIKLSVARLDGGDDDEDRVQHPKDRQKGEPDQDQTKDHRECRCR